MYRVFYLEKYERNKNFLWRNIFCILSMMQYGLIKNHYRKDSF